MARSPFFLCDHLFAKGYLNIVEQRLVAEERNPKVDQQPVDACSDAAGLSGSLPGNRGQGLSGFGPLAYQWYLGKNINKLPCTIKRQGLLRSLTPEGVNPNQGAEALLSWLVQQSHDEGVARE